ncbi:Tat pathway signal protein [Aliiroseovarius sp. KMU-50]|uniref:Tat pathway signal protein n=1 Tax=Aliiroseovarius salicola TaxID=3009082 RepID=A0ABT4W0W6_9RHOB|nr:Tat pathway signal protein [Aliiroseovarius sp. KMU-50]MDA5094154.1 Tat pathway signal protein [Aliiroseovarius sp. KMU-50]
MSQMNRRVFLSSVAAAASLRVMPPAAKALSKTQPGKRILELVYDKSMGMMRAVDRLVP